MRSEDKKTIAFLKELGLDEEQTEIYLALVRKGVLTTLALSHATSINRTRVYRLLEKLKVMGLVEEVVDEYKRKAKAVGPDSLAKLIKEQETKLEKLNSLFPEVSAYISAVSDQSLSGTKVLFYRGKDGIKRLVWNVLRTKGECLGYTYIDLNEALGEDLAEAWRREIVKRNIRFRDITCEPKVFSYTTNVAGYNNRCKTRYLPKSVLTIDHQIDIYNDVIAFYSWKEEDVFGVEIYNATIVRLQKQIFNLLWRIAKERE